MLHLLANSKVTTIDGSQYFSSLVDGDGDANDV